MDREKVISWVEGLAEDDWRLFHSDSEVQNIAKAVLAMLKEQEKQKFFVDENGKITPLPVVVRCKDCKFGEPWGVLIGCGTTKGFGITHDPDWFCADGERKEGR